MEKLLNIGRIFYGVALVGIGFQQFYYGDFHSMILPPKHAWIPGLVFWSYITGAGFMAAALAIIIDKKGREVSLALGGILLSIFLFYYIPYEIIVEPYSNYLGTWGDAEKELALSGGAFLIAGSFPEKIKKEQREPLLRNILEKLIPFGGVFFSITMISFGIDHLLYTKSVALLVPVWIPYPIFWTYFAAVALIGSGLAILLKIKLRLIATLLGMMIFLWFIFLHIPRAIDTPFEKMGEEVTSAFSALAFAGTAFVIAGSRYAKNGWLRLDNMIQP